VLAASAKQAVEGAQPAMATIMGAGMVPFPRVAGRLTMDDGVDGWAAVMTYRFSTVVGFDSAHQRVARFIEAWTAVQRMRGLAAFEECLDDGKV
jgi:hypothetical protein